MKTCLLSLGIASLLGAGELFGSIQVNKQLAAKKYIALTHDFTPGIPRWPGFPDESRKTIYWYDKRPDTRLSAFPLRFPRRSSRFCRKTL